MISPQFKKAFSRIRNLIIKTHPKKNLSKMLSTEEGGMEHLLKFMCIGGLNGSFGGYSCSSTNFLYDSETGDFVAFTNRLNENGLHEGRFRLTIDPIHKRSFIVNYQLNPRSSQVAKFNIRKYISLYNLTQLTTSEYPKQ